MEELVYRERRGTDCVKWDILGRKYKNPDLLSMWIADMDFCAPECVVRAMEAYAARGIFGYHLPPASCQQAFIDWERERYDFHVAPEWLRFSPGAVSALHFCVSALTEPGDAVAAMTPVYPAFLSVPKKTGRRLVTCPLINENGRYAMDLAGLEKAFAEEGVRLLIHCSPHNPVGRVWTEEEQLALLELCRRYQVIVISDEVHQDLCRQGNRHVPLGRFTAFSDLVVCVTSPAKTFNLAGCHAATMIIPDEENRSRIDALLDRFGISKGSSFSYIASEAAYAGGEEWLSAVLAQIGENEAYVRAQLAEKAPDVVMPPLEGTYLLWLDFSRLVPAEEFRSFMEKECGLALNYGEEFGGAEYQCFVRMNIATSFDNVQRAVGNILSALQKRAEGGRR